MQIGFLGMNSSIISTTNGGHSWTRHALPNQMTATAIDFVTPSLGWGLAQGDNGSQPTVGLLKTMNGGRHWTTQLLIPTGHLANGPVTASRRPQLSP